MHSPLSRIPPSNYVFLLRVRFKDFGLKVFIVYIQTIKLFIFIMLMYEHRVYMGVHSVHTSTAIINI